MKKIWKKMNVKNRWNANKVLKYQFWDKKIFTSNYYWVLFVVLKGWEQDQIDSLSLFITKKVKICPCFSEQSKFWL